MADWKPLPDTLDADVRNLIDQLRECKDRSGLSLSSLAERTLHSKSSWERYLNAKAFPPQQAVDSLGRIVGADKARLAALWELADRAWSGRHAPEPPPPTPGPAASPAPSHSSRTAATEPSPHGPDLILPTVASSLRARKARRGAFVVAVAAVAALAVIAAVVWWKPAPPAGPHTGPATSATDTESGALRTRCFQDSCGGKNPNDMGCAGDAWTAALTRVHGVYVELRYSDSCKAAWARISWGSPGDTAKVVANDGASYQEHVHYDTDVYSPMVASDASSKSRACVILTSGAHGCTTPGGSVHLTEPPEPVTSASATGR